MTASLPPNSELVAVAWLSTVTGITAGMVATQLPKDQSSWSTNGFVTIGGGDGSGGAVIGGAPNAYMALRAPVVSIHTWATVSGSARPPWGRAAHLAELVVAACYDEDTLRRHLTLPGSYLPARLNEAKPLSEPRRVPGDSSGYAHYQMDLQLHWVALT